MTFRFPFSRWPTSNLMTFKRVQVPGGPPLKGDENFIFRLNPTTLKVTRPKLENWTLTKGGFERQFWRNDLVRFAYTGTSGAFRPDEIAFINEQGLLATDVRLNSITSISSAEYDIRETFAWKKFEQFETFYRDHDEDFIQMNYWGQPRTWVGSLNGFEFDEDANNPRQIKYIFTFTGIPDDGRPSVQGVDVRTRSDVEAG